MSNADAPVERAPIGVSYLAGFIFLSYVISMMGCTTTLELLHRRTARAGLYNWYLLLTSSVAMGGVGIWCMHFIGNRAIVLGNGESDIQILYSVTFTGVSFVLPVIVLLAAFYAIGTSEKAGYIRIITGGVLTGCSVCGMHYIGQLGIANYHCSYRAANVAAAAIIAVFASTTALSIFFRWRATWTDSWWRRGICGCLLAAAVSGMHWTAAVGTSYRNHDPSVNKGGQLSRTQTVIICAVLACAACGVLSACAVVAGGHRRKLRAQAQQLVLTCAFFDPEGRIMVTPHALLPSRKIVDRYIGRTFNEDDLTRTHPAFLWAVRASRNWKVVRDAVPLMRGRIESDEATLAHYISKGVFTEQETELQPHFDDLFKRHFCVTAQDLADEVRQPLQDMGILYDHVLATSTPSSRFSRAMGYSMIRAGKGQLLFTVRQLKKHEASRMAAAGFRFTTIENVTTILSRRIHVPVLSLGTHLKDMRDYASSHRIFEPGVHLISFIMRPTIHDHFEVLTAKGTGNPLPSSTLSTKRLQIKHLEMIAHMEGWTMSTCLNWLKSDNARAYKDIDEFREQLIHAITTLSSSLPPDVNLASKFSARPLIAPCRINRISDGQNCILLPFCVVGSLDTQISNTDYSFTPLRLFRVQQQTNDGLSESDGFAKELSEDLLYSKTRPTSSTDSDFPDSIRSKIRFWNPRKVPDSMLKTDSQESLSENTITPEIMVRKEVKVDVAKLAEPTFEPSLGRHASQTTVVAGEMAFNTYVDELYNLCYSPGVRLRPDPAFSRKSIR
ncbi:MHYT domain signaling protein [Aspergillus flavus]|nr:MHYT domain signaling protein [Aspergillus flavus]RAQ72270.1 MHYT domain signaling protein [Aspergillus flavus]